jgi:hypothetical protein
MFKPVTPDAPNRSNRNPPTRAPTIPSRNIEPKALALLIDDLASDKPGNQAEYDPADDAHVKAPCKERDANSSGSRPEDCADIVFFKDSPKTRSNARIAAL